MFVSDSIGINEKGNLTFSGVDTVSLAKEFGTPLYAMNENGIRNNFWLRVWCQQCKGEYTACCNDQYNHSKYEEFLEFFS